MANKSTEPAFVQYIHARAAALGKPCSGTFELTARCNFSCKMCYVHSAGQQPCAASEQDARWWLDVAEEACGCGMLFLLLTGGEPLLREDFTEIYRKLREKGLLISVNTNGSLLGPETKKLFEAYKPKRLNISLYGASEDDYESVCGRGGFEVVTENIRSFVAAGIPVKLNMTVTEYNAAALWKIRDFAAELNIPLQAATYVFPPSRAANRDFGRLEAAQAARLETEYVRSIKTPAAMREYAAGAFEKYKPRLTCEGHEGVTCRAGKSSFWITWDGKMLPCGMMTQPFVSVAEKGFTQAWQEIRSASERICLPPECADCTYRNVCQVCAAKCLCETGAFDKAPSYICETAKAKFGILEKIIDSYGDDNENTR